MNQQLFFDLAIANTHTPKLFGEFILSPNNYIAHEILSDFRHFSSRFLYLSGEKYSGKTHYITQYFNHQNAQFYDEDALLIADLIIVDDADRFFGNNPMALFHLINEIHAQNRFLLLTNRTSLGDFQAKMPIRDVQSRLNYFYEISFGKPTFRIARQIIHNILCERQIFMTMAEISYIVEKIQCDYPAIDFIIEEISTQHNASRKIIRPLVKEILNNYAQFQAILPNLS